MGVPFRFLAGAWNFCARQPALRTAAFALVFLPLLASSVLDSPGIPNDARTIAVLAVLQLALTVLLTWGNACVLTVGERMLKAKSGRLRTSFKAVRSKAAGLVVPLLLTNLLGACIGVLWGVPLALFVGGALLLADSYGLTVAQLAVRMPWIPLLAVVLALLPVRYVLRVILSPMVVAYEGLSFRPALRRSAELTRGRLGMTIYVVAVLGILGMPQVVAATLLEQFARPTVAAILAPIVNAAWGTLVVVAMQLSLTQFYKALAGSTAARDGDDE